MKILKKRTAASRADLRSSHGTYGNVHVSVCVCVRGRERERERERERRTKDRADGMRERSAHSPRWDSNLYLWHTRPSRP